MTKSLKERAEITTGEVQEILSKSPDMSQEELAEALERAITKALLGERRRCADIALNHVADHDKANLLSEEINRVNTALIANLSAMR